MAAAATPKKPRLYLVEVDMPPFLPQAKPIYPDNADFSRQLYLLGDTIGKGIGDYRNQQRLLQIGEAAKGGNYGAARDAAFDAGRIDLGIKFQELAAPTVKPTDEIKEYQFDTEQLRAAGRPVPTFGDWKAALKKAGATNVNVNTGEKAYDTKVAGAYGDMFVEFQKAGRNAAGQKGTLDLMENLTKDPNFYSGAGGEAALKANQALVGLGIKDPKATSANETFQALGNKLVLDAAGGSLGPAISNADRDYIGATVPNLTKTPEGNRELIGMQRKLVKRQEEVAALARMYANDKGRLDPGFDDLLAKWTEKNPLFKSAPSGGGSAGPKIRTWNPATGRLE
jgi:hypothetical protein